MRVSSYFALFLAVCSGAFAADANFEAAIIDDYVAVSRAQESRLEGATMEVDIAADVPQLHKSGRLHALRRISALGRRITYDALRFEGDHSVKNGVIDRYLTAESEAMKTEPAATAQWMEIFHTSVILPRESSKKEDRSVRGGALAGSGNAPPRQGIGAIGEEPFDLSEEG